MSGHTPGPWVATERSGYHEILAPCTDADWYGREKMHAVAYVDTEIDEAEQNANARLIAAAPDLLEALTNLVAHYAQLVNCGDCGNWDPETEHQVIAARAALAKAQPSKETQL